MAVITPYTPPDFTRPELLHAPVVRTEPAPADAVAPAGFHATSNHPEYVHLGSGTWLLAGESRMDAVMVLRGSTLEVVEPRRLRLGDPVVIGRGEEGEEGIYVHTGGFGTEDEVIGKFGFRRHDSRETPFSGAYDRLYEVLRHDRTGGYIVWVLGPAVAFDRDSRDAMTLLIRAGYCHAMMAGNALATHDLEAARYRTGLGVDISSRRPQPGGHYHHLDIINEVRHCGSIREAIALLRLEDGIMAACEHRQIPYVLAGSIRDDGPLPGVISDARLAQDAMRRHARRATTVIAVATQLHAIAFGNLLPSYRLCADGSIRPVFFFVVDMSEFAVGKASNRGSDQAVPIMTNARDFLVNLRHTLCRPEPGWEGV